MAKESLVLGIDLGTSGVRLAVINQNYSLKYCASNQYQEGLEHCDDWKNCCRDLIYNMPIEIKKKLISCSIAGTSGTLMGCNYQGNPLGEALPYFVHCKETENVGDSFANYQNFLIHNPSILRASQLIKRYGKKIFLRHQADWISGWLLDDWSYGEEANNIKIGWDIIKKTWSKQLRDFPWFYALPRIIPSGHLLGEIAPKIAMELDLPRELKVIAGTTDSNAAVLATDATYYEGITVLGSTIVIKLFTKTPIKCLGITNHRVGGEWITGGASNAGCAVLKKFFSEEQLIELSRQIDPESNSGLHFRPLPSEGERFPVNDPKLEPILTPRPVSDSLYLHGLLEGLSKIEAQGWRKFKSLGLVAPNKIITIGGGSRNPQWRRIREKYIGIPIRTCSKQPAEGVARIALKAIQKQI